MRVAVLCEFSGTVRDAFIRAGHDAISCDLEPSESKLGPHLQGDVFKWDWCTYDLIIAHPPCTYLCVTGNKWMKPEFADRFPHRHEQRQEAIQFFLDLYNLPVDKIAIENPVGIMSTVWRKPDQYIHPYYFGDPHSKKTGLWLKGLPLLETSNVVEPQMYTYKDGRKDPIWHVESMKLDPIERAKVRNRTFQGIADAMVSQWGKL